MPSRTPSRARAGQCRASDTGPLSRRIVIVRGSSPTPAMCTRIVRGGSSGRELVRPLDDRHALPLDISGSPRSISSVRLAGAVGVDVMDGQAAPVLVDQHERGARRRRGDAEPAHQPLDEARLARASSPVSATTSPGPASRRAARRRPGRLGAPRDDRRDALCRPEPPERLGQRRDHVAGDQRLLPRRAGGQVAGAAVQVHRGRAPPRASSPRARNAPTHAGEHVARCRRWPCPGCRSD